MPSRLLRWSPLVPGLVPVLTIVIGPYHVAGSAVAHGMALVRAMSLPSMERTVLAAVLIVALAIVALIVGIPAYRKRKAKSRLEIAVLDATTAILKSIEEDYNAQALRTRMNMRRSIRRNNRRSIRRTRRHDPG